MKSLSSSSHVCEHDVFLSFRGEDTRHNFTDHLYHALIRKGIITFRDAEKLQKGNSVLPKLFEAIQQSRCAVIIFSTNYASSSWCLNELVHILECQELKGLVVFPVFYHVEPTQVRKQTGVYEEALSAHEKDVNNNAKVDIWRNALTKVANFSGWDVKNRSEAEVIEEIAEKIFNVLKDTIPAANNDLIGMDSRTEKVESYLDLSLDVVRTVGIWGMGGIGKTTLAQEVFKKIRENFQASAFVANVGEKSGDDLVDLQKSLYKSLLHSDVDIYSVDMGKNLLRKGLRSKKVLIILDDVHELKQMEALAGSSEQNHWLGPGSRVIITTRDEQLLMSYQAHKIYEVEKLTDAEASQLLCQKAFKKNHAPSDYLKLSNNFVKYAGGLPLALEVLGSYLCGKEVIEWSAAWARLYEDPEEGILSVLQLSYNGLNKSTLKDMFLDIACFFRGEDQDRVMKIFTSCDFHPEIGINDLINKSLIRIEGKKLWMHDLLQQMGWQIVRQESPKKPGKRSRLWLNENDHEYECRRSWLDEEKSSKRRRLWLDKDACDVLKHNAGTKHVEGLFLSLQEKEEMHLNADPFYKMPNLRLLKIYNVNFSGCIEHISLSQNLRLLEWHEFPLHSLPSSFKPDLLVELTMPNSRITRLWSETVSAEWLTLMDLSNCQYLTRTPDFSTVPKLERLILQGCKRLSEVHPTIGGLKHLVLLNLKGCESVESLPDSISLESLKTLVLSGCLKLKGFPEIMGNMENLSELHLDGTAISELPISIQHLSGLIVLNLRGCKKFLQSLPKYLPLSLKFIDARDCPMPPTNFPKNCVIWTSDEGFSFVDVESSVKDVEEDLLNLIRLKYIEDRIYHEKPFAFHFYNTRIPDWCGHSRRGSSVTIPLSDPEDGNSTWMGCVLFVVFKIHGNRNLVKGPFVLCRYMPQRQFSGKLNKASRLLRASVSTVRPDLKVEGCGIQQISQQGAAMFVRHLTNIAASTSTLQLHFHASVSTVRPDLKVEGCGIQQISQQGAAMFVRHLTNIAASTSTLQLHFHTYHTIPLSDPEDGNSTWMGCVLFVVFKIHGNRNLVKGPFVLCRYMPQRQFSGKLNKASRLLRASVSTVRPDLKVEGCGIQQISQQGAAMFVRHLTNIAASDLKVEGCGIQQISQQGAAMFVRHLTNIAASTSTLQLHFHTYHTWNSTNIPARCCNVCSSFNKLPLPLPLPRLPHFNFNFHNFNFSTSNFHFHNFNFN